MSKDIIPNNDVFVTINLLFNKYVFQFQIFFGNINHDHSTESNDALSVLFFGDVYMYLTGVVVEFYMVYLEQEGSTLGIVPCLSQGRGPIFIDTSTMPVFVAEVPHQF